MLSIIQHQALIISYYCVKKLLPDISMEFKRPETPTTAKIAAAISQDILDQAEAELNEGELHWMVVKLHESTAFVEYALVYVMTTDLGEQYGVPVKRIKFASNVKDAQDQRLPGLYTEMDTVNFDGRYFL